MRVIGEIHKNPEENVVRVYDDNNVEMIGVTRVVLHADKEGQVIITLKTLMANLPEIKADAIFIRGEKHKIERQKKGSGYVAVRDQKTGFFILDKFDGIANVEIKRV